MKTQWPQIVGFAMRWSLVALLLGSGLNSHARIISFEFEGTLTQVLKPEDSDIADVVVGDPFSGTLTYDTTPQNPHIVQNRATYSYYTLSEPPVGALIQMHVRTPHLHDLYLPGAPGEALIILENSLASDSFEVWGEVHSWLFLSITLEDDTGAALRDFSLPTDLNLAHWTRAYLALDIRTGSEVSYVRGDISSVRRVPETGDGAILLGLAFAALFVARCAQSGLRCHGGP